MPWELLRAPRQPARSGTTSGCSARCPVRQAPAALLEDLRRAGAAHLAVEPRVDRGDGLPLAPEHVVLAEHLVLLAAPHHRHEVGLDPDEPQVAAQRPPPLRLLPEHLAARAVAEADRLGADDEVAAPRVGLVDGTERRGDVLDRPEEQRALDAQERQLRAAGLPLLDRRPLAPRVLGGVRVGHHLADRGAGGALQVEHERDEHPGEDALLEVDEGAEEGDEEDQPLARVATQDRADVVPVDQAPRDDEEDRRHRGHREVGRERGHEQEDEEEEPRGEGRGEGCAGAGGVVDAGAVERAARGVRREEAAGDVGQPLADELLVAVDPLPGLQPDRPRDGHRLGEREQRDDEGGEDRRAQRLGRQVGHRQRGQRRGERPDGADDVLLLRHPLVDEERDDATGHHREDHVRQLRGQPLGDQARRRAW